jgi:beta-glucanase (GH16 family)
VFSGHLTSHYEYGYGDLEFRAMFAHSTNAVFRAGGYDHGVESCTSVSTDLSLADEATLPRNSYVFCVNSKEPTQLKMTYFVGDFIDPTGKGQTKVITGVDFTQSYNTFKLRFRENAFQWLVNGAVMWDSRDSSLLFKKSSNLDTSGGHYLPCE